MFPWQLSSAGLILNTHTHTTRATAYLHTLLSSHIGVNSLIITLTHTHICSLFLSLCFFLLTESCKTQNLAHIQNRADICRQHVSTAEQELQRQTWSDAPVSTLILTLQFSTEIRFRHFLGEFLGTLSVFLMKMVLNDCPNVVNLFICDTISLLMTSDAALTCLLLRCLGSDDSHSARNYQWCGNIAVCCINCFTFVLEAWYILLSLQRWSALTSDASTLLWSWSRRWSEVQFWQKLWYLSCNTCFVLWITTSHYSTSCLLKKLQSIWCEWAQSLINLFLPHLSSVSLYLCVLSCFILCLCLSFALNLIMLCGGDALTETVTCCCWWCLRLYSICSICFG